MGQEAALRWVWAERGRVPHKRDREENWGPDGAKSLWPWPCWQGTDENLRVTVGAPHPLRAHTQRLTVHLPLPRPVPGRGGGEGGAGTTLNNFPPCPSSFPGIHRRHSHPSLSLWLPAQPNPVREGTLCRERSVSLVSVSPSPQPTDFVTLAQVSLHPQASLPPTALTAQTPALP